MRKTWTSQPRSQRRRSVNQYDKTTDLQLHLENARLNHKEDEWKKELFAHVQALTAQMEEKEKETFYKEAEKEGF